MIVYRFTVNNVVIPEPDNIGGWERLITNIKRDSSELRGLLITQDVELEFIGDQYRFFKDAYFNTGICAEYPVLIEQSYDGQNFDTLHKGIIKLRDIVLKDMLQGLATAKVNDDSFYARINNNKSISTSVISGSSKNGIPIDPCSVFAVNILEPATAAPIGSSQLLFVFDVMRYLVRFMSDDEVGFESTLLQTTLPMMIQQGGKLRTGTDPSPYWEISFGRLFDNIRKLRNVGWRIEEDATGKPIFRLELSEFFYEQDHAQFNNADIVFTDPTTLETSVNFTELYGKLKIGSTTIFDSPTVTYPESIRFNGFKEEEFYVLGQCNIDNTLDLTKDLIISSNVIEAIIVDNDDTWDDDLVLMVVENVNTGAFTADAKMSNPAGAVPPTFFNMDLRNSQVAPSFFSTFQGGLVAGFLNFFSNDFQAMTNVQAEWGDNTVPPIPLFPAAPLVIDPVDFQLLVDVAGNFNLATDQYTAPATGYYTFNFYGRFKITGFNPNGFLDVGFGFDINGVKTIFYQQTWQDTNLQTFTYSQTQFLTAGDTIHVYLTLLSDGGFGTAVNQRFTLLQDTKFSATATPDTGGVVQDYDPQDLRNVFMKFKYPVSARLFDSIKSQLTKKYSIYLSGKKETYTGWIESFSYPHKDEIPSITLKTSVNTINASASDNVLTYPAYRFIFSMQNVTDEITEFTYNSGGSTVVMSVDLTQNISDIIAQITTAFTGAAITVNEIIISRASIGGALYSYEITIVNPNFDISDIDISGTPYTSSFFYY